MAAESGLALVSSPDSGAVTLLEGDPLRVAKVFRHFGAPRITEISPDGESARTIVILDTSDPSHPRAIGQLRPGFSAHDLSFSPDGRRVWVSSASGRDVGVFRASDHQMLYRVPVGQAPQHIAFDGAFAYLTSGYGRMIEKVATSTGTVIGRASTPYGSFELAAADGFVATASLLDGELAIYTPQLKLLRLVRLASATRDVAITDP